MIEGLKPYAEYRESSVPWIGRIPTSWKVVRNGNLFGQRNQTNCGHLPILEVSLRTGVRVRDFSGSARKQVMSDVSKYKRAARGDLAYNMMRMWQGAVGVAPVDGLVSPAYVVATPFSETLADFYSHLFRTQTYQDQVDAYSRGIVKDRNRLYWADFKRMPSLCPPFEQQSAIVHFLRYAGRCIEAFIRGKRKLISLLNEQKQAIIQRAVTRGLTPDVKLKPSGIEWLGEVPEHWEVVTLARLLAFGPKNGVSPPPASQNLQGAISFSISAIRDGKVIIKGNEKQVTLAHAFVSRFQVCHGDVLLVRGNGNLDFVARCGLVTECPANTVYPDIIIKIRSNEQIAAELLVHAINSKYVRSQVACVAKTTNGAHKISGGTLSALKLLVPPVSEQQPLLDWIASSVGTLDRACHVGSNHIDLIREYHARLVSDVVTGQLDIREVARQLPDEIARSSNDFDLDDANEDAESDLEPSEVEADV